MDFSTISMKKAPLQRKRIKRSQKSMARSKLKPVSVKRAKLNREYAKLRKAFLAEYRVCQVAFPDFCTRAATQVHHRHGRGKNLNNVSTWSATCAECHAAVHRHGKKARALGFLV